MPDNKKYTIIMQLLARTVNLPLPLFFCYIIPLALALVIFLIIPLVFALALILRCRKLLVKDNKSRLTAEHL